jgi:glycosyltransferase involved in cell wall biosynthesis
VIINGMPLYTPRTGVANYVYHNFKALLKIQNGWDCRFFYGFYCSSKFRDRPAKLYMSAKKMIRLANIVNPFYKPPLDLLFRVAQWREKFDLYHEPNYILMPYDGPTILTIPDLSFLLYPDTLPVQLLRYFERYFHSRLSCVNHFVAISESTKRDMVRLLGLPEGKITVTPLGVNENFKPLPIDTVTSTLSRYGLEPRSYILYVGTLEPRKNVITLLRAYASLSSSLRNSHPLVLAGQMGWRMEGFDETIRKLDIQSNIVKPGFVPDDDLVSFYNGASVFVYPSLYEGFGLPPLEAMACGVPVITSNVSSLPEVIGDAGILIQPKDENKLKEEIESLLTTPDRRRILGQMGIKRAGYFTWERCADKTLEVYDRVMSA